MYGYGHRREMELGGCVEQGLRYDAGFAVPVLMS